MRTSLCLLVACFAFAAAPAVAQVTFSGAGPFDSDLDSVPGGANGTANAFYSTLTFTGTLTEIDLATFGTEAQFIVDSGPQYQVSTTTGFVGSIAVANTLSGFYWGPSATGAVSVDTVETFDDGADGIPDATWTDIDFLLSTLR